MEYLSLINMKEDKNNFGTKIFKPTKKNSYEYKLIFKSDNPIYIQFQFYEKLMDLVEFRHKELTNKYKSIPVDGILISCIITNINILEIIVKPIDLCSRIIIKEFKNNILCKLYFKNISWDNIFIINLSRRTDRKKLMEKKLSQANITKYEFIDGFDGQELYIKEKFLTYKNHTNIISSGHFACLLSHIKAIKLAKKRKYSSIMILEDDVYFCNEFLDKLTKLLVPYYDMLYLGGIISKKKLFYTNWTKYNKIMGAYGYILNNTMYDIILIQLEKLAEYIDVFYLKEIQSKYSIVLLNDYIKTDLISTDTSYKSNILIKRLEYIK